MTVTLSRWDKAPFIFINGDLPEHVIEELNTELSYEDPNAEWTTAWKDGNWDGFHRLLRRSKNDSLFFPVGLLDDVKQVLDVFGIEYELAGIVRPGQGDLDLSWNTEMILRDYQSDAVNTGLRRGAGVVVLPTASGKTLIGLRLMYRLQQPTIVFCHVQEVANQWAEDIRDVLGVDPAICYGGTRENGDIMVALYQSVYDDDTGELRDDVRLDHTMVQFDEAHREGARTFSKVAMGCPAVYRYGFTATPEREDNATKRVFGGIGPIIANLSAEHMISNGYIAEPHWEIHDAPRSGGAYNKWQDEYRGEIVGNNRRNRLIRDKIVALDKPCLVTVEYVNHGERLCSLVTDVVDDGDVAFVHGNASGRDENIQAFRDGDLPVLIATRGIVGEGFDVPSIRSFVVAGGLKSSTSMIQQVGRALRPGESGEATIVDFIDMGQWIGEHSESRIRTYMDYYGDYGP